MSAQTTIRQFYYIFYYIVSSFFFFKILLFFFCYHDFLIHTTHTHTHNTRSTRVAAAAALCVSFSRKDANCKIALLLLLPVYNKYNIIYIDTYIIQTILVFVCTNFAVTSAYRVQRIQMYIILWPW